MTWGGGDNGLDRINEERYNNWNVSLWVTKDQRLYHLAQDCMREFEPLRKAAEAFLHVVKSMDPDNGMPRTPDGAPYTINTIVHAMRELK